jgi:hypothetical protein
MDSFAGCLRETHMIDLFDYKKSINGKRVVTIKGLSKKGKDLPRKFLLRELADFLQTLLGGTRVCSAHVSFITFDTTSRTGRIYKCVPHIESVATVKSAAEDILLDLGS